MARATLTWLHLLGGALILSQAVAQKCYYPNGKEAAEVEKPCSSADGSACCPDKWICLDNGLCHYPPDNLFGRYSCTDKDWKAPGCASNLCTYNMNAVGGESITQCKDKDDQWCCNADAVHVNCCKESPEPRPFFALQDGQAYATIGSQTADEAPNLASITGEATGSGGSQPSKTPDPSSDPLKSSDISSNKPTPTSPTTPVTSLQTSVSSGNAGVETIIVTSVIQPTADPTAATASSSNDDSNSNNIPIIVGCAVGIPLSLALVGILFWLFRKRRQQKQQKPNPYEDPYLNGTGSTSSPEFSGGAKLTKSSGPKATTYRHSGGDGVPELQSQAVGPDRPISIIQGKAELASGAGFAAGAAAPHAPHLVGVGGGTGSEPPGRTSMNSWESAPPGYSPAMNQAAWTPGHHPSNSVELDATSVAPTRVQPGPTTQQQYIPYRPPAGHERTASGGGPGRLPNVPEMSELSAVRTPPA